MTENKNLIIDESGLCAKDRRILERLAIPRNKSPRNDYRESELPRVSFDYLQQMYFDGLIEGAGIRDDRGAGNYKHTRLWWITEKGRALLKGKP